MKKTLLKKAVMLMTALTVGFAFSVTTAFGAEEGQRILGQRDRVIGVYNAAGEIVFQPATADYKGAAYEKLNALDLTQLCKGNAEKTIVIPAGTDVKINFAIKLGDNTTIKADGATIIQTDSKKGMMANDVDALNYNSLKNVKIIGGTWKTASSTGLKGTMFKFAHAQNILFDGCNISSNYAGHSIELIACKNATVQNCVINGVGSASKTCLEEQIQIDIATPKTAPGIVQYGTKYVKGQTCKNIKILNNTIKGARGVCANYASKESKFRSKFHSNITVSGNTITGVRSEALALFNTTSATVTNNKIYSKGSRTSSAYTVGIHCALFGKAPKSIKKAKITISGNTVKGGRQAVQVYSHTSSKYGKVSIAKNKLYCKKGKKNALKAPKQSISKVSTKGNKTYKW